MKIEFAPAQIPHAGTLVVLAAQDGALGERAAELDRGSGGLLRRALQQAGESFKRGQAIELLYPAGLGLERLILLGLGKPGEATALECEGLGGSLIGKLRGARVSEAAVLVEAVPGLAVAPARLAAQLAGGARLRGYRFEKYQTQKDGDEEPSGEIAKLTFLLAEPEAAREAWAAGDAVVQGVSHARDLVSEPANVLSPERFAEECETLGRAVGLAVEILRPKDMAELGMRALLGVAQGSAREPRVAVLRWNGGSAGQPPIALVGKGVCFDSGGLSLKSPSGMEGMKQDMAGAAAAFGAMEAIARRGAKAHVVAILGLTENMPSGTAQRPGDVIASMAGLTIEVANTDAEGRLVLADALHYAKARFQPKVIVDIATLTGAIILALGREKAGLFASDDNLARSLHDAGEEVGESLWRMPLDKCYEPHISSQIADLRNIGRPGEASPTAGAMFLKRFVGDVPWAHIDMTGMGWTQKDLAICPSGATGFGVRLLDRYIRNREV